MTNKIKKITIRDLDKIKLKKSCWKNSKISDEQKKELIEKYCQLSGHYGYFYMAEARKLHCSPATVRYVCDVAYRVKSKELQKKYNDTKRKYKVKTDDDRLYARMRTRICRENKKRAILSNNIDSLILLENKK